jgi:hypothetical protein
VNAGSKALAAGSLANEKATLACGSLETVTSKRSILRTALQVKRESRQNLNRWLTTGHSYHLRLCLVARDALRKGVA